MEAGEHLTILSDTAIWRHELFLFIFFLSPPPSPPPPPPPTPLDAEPI